MGERGPLKKPVAHRRNGELLEELTPCDAPPPPERLNAVAAEVWCDLAAMLAPVGRLRPEDHALFEVLCCAVSDFRAARELIDRSGVVSLLDGALLKNPALAVQKDAGSVIAQLGPKFGLSPSDRERAKAQPVPSRADQRLPGSQGGRPRRKTGQAPPLRVVAPGA